MHHRLLPEELKERVRRYDQYKWLETRGVDEESLVQNLPKDLRRDIKRHLCLNLVRRVSIYFLVFNLLAQGDTCQNTCLRLRQVDPFIKKINESTSMSFASTINWVHFKISG